MQILSNSEALDHCRQLSNLIDDAVEKSSNGLLFSDYMNLALYAPNLGYYTAGAYKFGEKGDFITAPEISPLFGATLAQTIAPVLKYFLQSNQPSHILEFGAGSGKLATNILQELLHLDALPDVYRILEVSADLQQRQKDFISCFLKEHQIPTKVEWINVLPDTFDGVILANEVLDAFAVDIIKKSENGWYYRGLTKNLDAKSPDFTDHWTWVDCHPVPLHELPEYLLNHSSELPVGYITETQLRAHSWMASIAEMLRQAIVITIDYGFPAREYYHPQRNHGTLMTHHQHHSLEQPFYLPGLCDLTAHVEWTSLNAIAEKKGLKQLAYLSQGAYLLEAGIGEIFMRRFDMNDPSIFLPQSNALQKLVSEAEMGELFKVAAWSSNQKHDPVFENLLEVLPGFTGRMRLL